MSVTGSEAHEAAQIGDIMLTLTLILRWFALRVDISSVSVSASVLVLLRILT